VKPHIEPCADPGVTSDGGYISDSREDESNRRGLGDDQGHMSAEEDRADKEEQEAEANEKGQEYS
jgi:hypothetical protein